MSEKFCCVEGCNRPFKARGFCHKHYQQIYKNHPAYKPRLDYNDRRKHPFYIIWWQRKRDNALCEEWLDFEKFINDISPKPEGNYFLIRLRDEPYGPNNFKWQEHLKRKKDETRKEWWARKWKARQNNNPGMENERNLKRKYGITVKEYNELLEKQNFVCAICENGETTVDGKTASKRKLAVDHCHKTNKIRKLLCWRCNVVIGKVEENIELLQKMINYLTKHNGIS